MNIKLEGIVKKSSIPPQERGVRKGPRVGDSLFSEIFSRLATIRQSEAICISHDAASAQVLHARVHSAAKECGLKYRVQVAVRGSAAYLSRRRRP